MATPTDLSLPPPAAARRRGDLTLSGFVGSAIVVAALIAGTYWLSVQERTAQSWVAHTEGVLDALDATRAHLVEMQNGMRGFVIGGSAADLQSYEAARSALRNDAVRVSELTADNPAQQANARELAARLAPRIEAADAVIAARRAGGFEAAKAAMDRVQGTQQQLHVRAVLDGMEVEERHLLAQRLAEHKARLEAFWASMAAVVLGLLAALSTIYLQVRRRRALEHQLLEREQQFHLMTDSITEYAILMLDLQGRIQTWNPGALRIKGYGAEEIIGRHFSCFYTPEDLRANKPDQALRLARSTGVFSQEAWRVRKDGSRFWASVTITPLRGRDGEVTGFCKITRDLSERKAAQDQLEALVADRTRELREANQELGAAKGRLERLSAQLISAQEQERRHIARELHDETGQALTLIRLNLAELGEGGAAAEAKIAQCVDHVDRAIKHIRGLSVRLRPPMLDDLGLVDAIEWALEQQGEAAGWRIRLDVPQELDRMPEHVETACFRICQEALTNAARYARATEVGVTLTASAGELQMVVADNGSGFDLERYRSVDERKKHFGLVSMTERAALAGGQLEIDTAPGRGTRVTARFPLQ